MIKNCLTCKYEPEWICSTVDEWSSGKCKNRKYTRPSMDGIPMGVWIDRSPSKLVYIDSKNDQVKNCPAHEPKEDQEQKQ